MGMGIGPSGNGPSAEMNVTPLIDVLLVLLIIFMVVIATPRNKGLLAEVPRPAENHESIREDVAVVLQVARGADNHLALHLNQESVEYSLLSSRLQEIYKMRATKVIFLKADPELAFEDIADVIDTAKIAVPGMEVGLMTEQHSAVSNQHSAR